MNNVIQFPVKPTNKKREESSNKFYKFLRLFFRPKCWHYWEIYQIERLFNSPEDKIPSGRRYTLRCSECGEIYFKNTDE